MLQGNEGNLIKVDMNLDIIKDLEYELRMLLGATKMCQLFDEYKVGNQINYFKDSAYIHARNLYNFFTRSGLRYDGSVTQFGGAVFRSPLFPNPWMEHLNRCVMHIRDRSNPAVVGGRHINTMIQDFSDDIRNLWQQWIDNTTDTRLKTTIQESLGRALKESEDDYIGMRKRLKKMSFFDVNDFFAKSDVNNNIRKIKILLKDAESWLTTVYKEAIFTEVIIKLSDLLQKLNIIGQRVNFNDDIDLNIGDVTDLVRNVRNAACHVDSEEHFLEDSPIKFTFNVLVGRGTIMKYKDKNGVEKGLSSEYDDDICFFFGENKIYLGRHITRAFNEATTRFEELYKS